MIIIFVFIIFRSSTRNYWKHVSTKHISLNKYKCRIHAVVQIAPEWYVFSIVIPIQGSVPWKSGKINKLKTLKIDFHKNL